MHALEQAVKGVNTHPSLRRFPEVLVEEEGGLPPASVPEEGTVVWKGLSSPPKCTGLAGDPGDGNKAGMCGRGGEYRHFLCCYQSPVEEVVRELGMVAFIVPTTNLHKPPGQRHVPGKQCPGAPQDRGR